MIILVTDNTVWRTLTYRSASKSANDQVFAALKFLMSKNLFQLLQYGAVIAQSIFSQIFTKGTP